MADEKPKKQLMSMFQDARSAFEKASKTFRSDFDQSELRKRLDDLTLATRSILEESGMKDRVSNLTNATQDHLDTLTGNKILQLVEERLELQSQYNDILAQKLEEALERIEKLEKEKASHGN